MNFPYKKEVIGENALTIAGDGLIRSAGKTPLEILQLGGCEEGRQAFIGRAGVAQAVQPNDDPPSSGHG